MVRFQGQHSLIDPEDDGCSDTDGGHEGAGASVILGVNAAPIFDFAEHVFDFMTLAVEHLIVGDKDLAVSL